MPAILQSSDPQFEEAWHARDEKRKSVAPKLASSSVTLPKRSKPQPKRLKRNHGTQLSRADVPTKKEKVADDVDALVAVAPAPAGLESYVQQVAKKLNVSPGTIIIKKLYVNNNYYGSGP